jgi:hypothetical protein
MASFTYVSNRKAVEKQLDAAFDSMIQYYFQALRAVIQVSRSWSGFEKNPFRSIVDTGEFRDSQGKEKLGRMAWNIFWLAEYSVFIRWGGKTPQNVSFPGRAFEEVALAEVDLTEFFIKAFQAKGNLNVQGVVLMSGQEL